MTRLTFFTQRTRALRVALACVALPLLCSAVDSQTVTITGNPTPPTTIAMYSPYNVTVTATPASTWFIYSVTAASSPGDQYGAYGPFIGKGTYAAFSNTCSVNVTHTFSVVNQDSGYYYWRGEATEIKCFDDGNTPFVILTSRPTDYFYTSSDGGSGD